MQLSDYGFLPLSATYYLSYMLLAIIIRVASAIRNGYQSWLMRLFAESCPLVSMLETRKKLSTTSGVDDN